MRTMARQAVLTLVFCCFTVGQCGVVYPTIRWTPYNPLFKKNALLPVRSYSKVTIVCPNPTTVETQQTHVQSKDNMYENIWLVDKQGYESCTVDVTKHRSLKQCNTPDVLNYLQIVFQHYTSLSDGLKFDRGKEYYLISTASGTKPSLSQTSGGRCHSHNMRLIFYVCNGDSDPKCQAPAQIAPTAVTVTKTVTQTLTVTKYAIQPTPSLSSTVSTIPAQAQDSAIRFKYATLLSSLASSSVSPSTISPSQTGMPQTAALAQPGATVQQQ